MRRNAWEGKRGAREEWTANSISMQILYGVGKGKKRNEKEKEKESQEKDKEEGRASLSRGLLRKLQPA